MLQYEGNVQSQAVGLRQRTLSVIGLTFIGLGAALYGVLELSLLRQADRLEVQQSLLLAEQAQSLLQQRIADLDRLANDWSAWEAAYQFALTLDPTFIRDNLNSETLVRNKYSWILFVDTAGEPIYGVALNDSNEASPLPSDLEEKLLQAHEELYPRNGSVTSGLLTWNNQIFAVASRPLRRGDGSGRSPGTAWYGQAIDAEFITQLRQNVVSPSLTHLEIVPIADLPQSTPSTSSLVVDSQNRLSYTTLNDVFGDETLAIITRSSRFFYQQGRSFATFLIVTVVILVLVGSLIVVVIVDRQILSRITELRHKFLQIAHNPNADLTIAGNDELSHLSEALHEVVQSWLHLQNKNLESERRYRTVIERAREAIWLVDVTTGQVIQANPAFQTLLKYDSLSNIYLTDFVVCDDVIGACDLLSALLPITQESPVEQCYRTTDHQLVDVEVSARHMIYGQREVVCVVAHDITARKQAEKQLRFQAYHDELTGLPNRRFLMQHLLKTLLRHEHGGCAALYITIDDFDVVNDSLGHTAGGVLLQAVAKNLREAIPPSAVFARLDSDEFVVVLTGVSEAHALKVAETLLAAAHQPIALPRQPLPLWPTICVGIALSQPSLSSEMLLRNADRAMYHAKAIGRGQCVLFTADMEAQAVDRLTVGLELRQALLDNELCLYYQPIVAIASGSIVAFEALVRWQHPQKGLVPPGLFLPIAQELGMMAQVDAWVLDAALAQLSRWQQEGLALPLLTINLSGAQLLQPQFCDYVRCRLAHYGIKPQQIKFELVENWLHETNTVLVTTLRMLQELGIQLCIDDFGTGYSSLARLNALPINTLKVDRAFLQQLSPASAPQQTLIATIISLAQSLKLDVVAEGVETAWQIELLQTLGCDYLQGYFLSRPVSAAAAGSLFNSGAKLLQVYAE